LAHRVTSFKVFTGDPAAAATWCATLFGGKTQSFDPHHTLMMVDEGAGMDGGVLHRQTLCAEKGSPINAFACTIGADDHHVHLAKADRAGAELGAPNIASPDIGWTASVHGPFDNIFCRRQDDPSAKQGESP
jgi:hypothetical protein